MNVIKKIIFIFIILTSVYGCAGTREYAESIREYAESVFLNLQSVSNRIVGFMIFEEKNEALIEQLEAQEEQINTECYALQQIGYRRMMGEPVSGDLEYEAAMNLKECNEVVIQADQFLKENGL